MNEGILDFGFEAAVIILLVLANGFFVASEFAIVKIRTTQLKPLIKAKNWRAVLAMKVVRNLNSYLSATQLGITLSSLGLGWLGEPYVHHWVEPILKSFGVGSPTVITTLSLGISFGIITFLHIVLGELIPKWFAIQKPKPMTLWLSPLLIIFYYVFYPAIWFLDKCANLVLHILGMDSQKEVDQGYSYEELQHVMALTRHTHSHDLMINKIILKALRLKETRAEQVMLPVEKLAVLWRDKPLEENMQVAQQTGYSRLPLCGNSMDEVLGVVHVKELLWQWRAMGEQTDLESLAHPVLVFNPKMRLPTMLDLFRSSRNHLAVVIDSDSRMIGSVSMEDVLEELVGDIRDEFDIETGPYYELNEKTALVDAELPVRDLAMETGWPLPTQTNDLLEDWCVARWGRVPNRGEKLRVENFVLIADQVSGRRLRRIRINYHRPADALDESQHRE